MPGVNYYPPFGGYPLGKWPLCDFQVANGNYGRGTLNIAGKRWFAGLKCRTDGWSVHKTAQID